MDHMFDTQPIEGWRAFKYVETSEMSAKELFRLAANTPASENPFEWAGRTRLQAVGHGEHRWVERMPQGAICGQGKEHIAPFANCSCGLWMVRGRARGYGVAFRYNAQVVGRVAGWGHFIEHRIGWRVQYAYPQELFVLVRPHEGDEKIAWAERAARDLEDLYLVPTHVHILKSIGKRQKIRKSKAVSFTELAEKLMAQKNPFGFSGLQQFVGTNIPTTGGTVSVTASSGTALPAHTHQFPPQPPPPKPPRWPNAPWPNAIVPPWEFWQSLGTIQVNVREPEPPF